VPAAAVLAGLASAVPASAAPCVSSTPKSISFDDSIADANDLAPDVVMGQIATDGSCTLTLRYVTDQDFMLESEGAVWFLDTDGNEATGNPSGFKGAEYAISLLGSGSAGLARYNPTTDDFDVFKQVPAAGAFATTVNLSDFDSVGGTTFHVAGGTSWKSSSTGNSYFDFAPNAGLPTVPFLAEFSSQSAPPPAAAPAEPPVASAPPATPPAVVDTAPKTRDCVVPNLKGLTVGVARKRLAAAGCLLGATKRRASRTFANRVMKSSPGRGATLAGGAVVNITVGKRPRRARRKAHAASNPLPAAAHLINSADDVR
jgi:hypothetical protein